MTANDKTIAGFFLSEGGPEKSILNTLIATIPVTPTVTLMAQEIHVVKCCYLTLRSNIDLHVRIALRKRFSGPAITRSTSNINNPTN